VKPREFISLFVGVAAAWSLAAHAQESGTLATTQATTATLPQIKVARVKPVDRTPPNLRLSDDRIDLMSGFSLSSAQAIGGAWGIPLRPSTPFDERYGQWWNPFVPGPSHTDLASVFARVLAGVSGAWRMVSAWLWRASPDISPANQNPASEGQPKRGFCARYAGKKLPPEQAHRC
jgi:hypothetical protein